MRWIANLVLLLIFLPLSSLAAEVGERHSLQAGERERTYYLYNPKITPSQPRPLVVVLHGGTGSPERIAEMTGFSALAKNKNFMVAYPAGSGRIPTWNAGKCCGYAERNQVDDVGFVRAMIDDIRQKAKVDNARIYVTGMSNGAMMAYKLACEMGDVFAAFAPVAGAMNLEVCAPEGRPSAIIFHAIDDKHVPFMGGQAEEGLRAALGKDPKPDSSVADAMQFWLQHTYCRQFPEKTIESDYEDTIYFCAEGRHVRLIALTGGGHTWPGSTKAWQGGDTPLPNVEATQMIWDFFNAHPPREVF